MPAARARVPKQVGRYQLVYELATSYLGPLWAARIEGGDSLALLRLVSLSRLDADARVRLLEAAWQAMEVRDDRVLPVTDVVASDGELSVVSEYAEGIPLRAIQTLASVRRKPMSVSVALRFILDLVDGVTALHRAMTELGEEAVPLFGGISADSVLVSADGHASLLDVAIASAASGVESLGGTPERAAYAAPEQLGGQPRADQRTDVFSVGTLAWELLANRRLFVGSDKAVAQKVLAAKVPKLEDAARKGEFQVPKPLGAAVLRALSLEPGARFASMAAFRKELEGVGVAPAEPAVVASYVATIADGAFARTRDALSLPPRPAPARAPEDAKPRAEPARATPVARPKGDPKPALPTRAAARPGVEPNAAAPARPMSQPRLGVPSQSNSTLPAKIRPRQQTMIGLPAPAGQSPSATPPAKPPATPVTEPPPSSSDEPTTQYSREHLKRLSELHDANASSRPPPRDVTAQPAEAPAPSKLVSESPPPLLETKPPPARAAETPAAGEVPLPRLVSLRPTPRALSELHTERPPPPELDPALPATPPAGPAIANAVVTTTDAIAPPARAVAPLPPAPEAPEDLQPVRIAAAPPPARVSTGGALAPSYAPPHPLASRNSDRTGQSLAPRAERPAFSRPPPATAAASFYPSQVAPPLVHDPRANRAPSVVPPRAAKSIRGVVLGVAASLVLVALSATVTLRVMTRQAEGASEDEHAAAANPRSETPTISESHPAKAGAPTQTVTAATAAASASAAPTQTVTTATTAASASASAEATQPAPVSSSGAGSAAHAVDSATIPSATSEEPAVTASPNTPSRAPARATPRTARKPAKKHGRFVPNDI
ncbi:MAG TPA: protein kinase [Polyangiaceae bacterium]|nr:protein kinase [Polyangiaceae bacterium]